MPVRSAFRKAEISKLSAKDLALLSAAVSQLECPTLAVRLAAVVGMPVEKLLGWLPDSIQHQIDLATKEVLAQALELASKTLDNETFKGRRNLTHKVAVTPSGVTGGLFGAPALFAELPVTTVINLLSIGDIARSQGENLSDPTVQLACLDVLALGSEGKQDSGEITAESAQRKESYIRSS